MVTRDSKTRPGGSASPACSTHMTRRPVSNNSQIHCNVARFVCSESKEGPVSAPIVQHMQNTKARNLPTYVKVFTLSRDYSAQNALDLCGKLYLDASEALDEQDNVQPRRTLVVKITNKICFEASRRRHSFAGEWTLK